MLYSVYFEVVNEVSRAKVIAQLAQTDHFIVGSGLILISTEESRGEVHHRVCAHLKKEELAIVVIITLEGGISAWVDINSGFVEWIGKHFQHVS